MNNLYSHIIKIYFGEKNSYVPGLMYMT